MFFTLIFPLKFYVPNKILEEEKEKERRNDTSFIHVLRNCKLPGISTNRQYK